MSDLNFIEWHRRARRIVLSVILVAGFGLALYIIQQIELCR